MIVTYELEEKIEIRGVIGETFLATINGVLVTLPITLETKTGIIKGIIPGPRPGSEFTFKIKFMCYQFPVEIDEDYITKLNYCDDKC